LRSVRQVPELLCRFFGFSGSRQNRFVEGGRYRDLDLFKLSRESISRNLALIESTFSA
jgi:hypothetical protein